MRNQLLLIILTIVPVAACGAVSDPDASGRPETYRGMLDDVPPVTFGGGQFCKYTITLRQVDIQITVDSSGQVTDAEARNLNIEATVPPCPFDSLDPTIATYMFESMTMTPEGIAVTLEAAPTNTPLAVLRLQLTRSENTYLAHFDYHRTDQASPLDWRVIGSLALSPQ